MKRVLKYIFYFISMLFVISLVISIIEKNFFHNDYPFVYKTGLILSGSMEPTLSVDDLVIVKKIDSISEGDIVLFYDEDNKEVMHRVVSINGNSVITKGDANNTEDEAIDINKISGKYVFRIKYIGKIINFIKTPLGIILVLALLTIIYFMANRKRKEKKKEKDNNVVISIIGYIFLIGTFSIVGYYAKYISNINGSASVRAALLTINKSQELTVNISSLKPGTTVKYRFGIKNYKGASKTEVVMNYNLNIVSYTSIPLNYSLKCVSSTGGTCMYTNKTAVSSNTVLSGGVLPYTDTTHTYELEINWDSSDNNIEYYGELGIIKILIDTTQKD